MTNRRLTTCSKQCSADISAPVVRPPPDEIDAAMSDDQLPAFNTNPDRIDRQTSTEKLLSSYASVLNGSESVDQAVWVDFAVSIPFNSAHTFRVADLPGTHA